MSVTVQVIYAADRTTSRIENVPISSPISTVKNLIAKINRLGSSDSIRLVQRGQVLDDSQILSGLSISDGSSVIVYATGIPTKVQARRPVARAVPERRSAKTFVKNHKVLVGICGLILILGSGILLALAEVVKIPAILTSDSDSLMGGYGLLVAVLVIAAIAGYGWWKAGTEKCLALVKLYAVTALPNFDVDQFKRDHHIE
jgi:hypothetical protein